MAKYGLALQLQPTMDVNDRAGGCRLLQDAAAERHMHVARPQKASSTASGILQSPALGRQARSAKPPPG